jgi:hypothetical protein
MFGHYTTGPAGVTGAEYSRQRRAFSFPPLTVLEGR